jgi:folate-binding protein YgfZ
MTETRFCPAPGLGLIRVSGRDARQFLHAQTTQRIDDLPPTESRLAAWLNAKGRVRALFHVVPDAEAFWLVLLADEIESVVRGLSLFVLRADVKLEPAGEFAVASLLGPAASWLAERGLELDAHAVTVTDGAIVVRQGQERIDIIANPESLTRFGADLAPANRDAFELVAVRQGLPAINAASREQYIPQMLNLERLGAVSFNKGCYPGQEIVARTQNLGAVKRRLGRFATGPGARPMVGDAVVAGDGEAQAGEVNRVAATPDGYELLAVVSVASQGLALGNDARVLERLPLPAID